MTDTGPRMSSLERIIEACKGRRYPYLDHEDRQILNRAANEQARALLEQCQHRTRQGMARSRADQT